jgi:hypothetical protein
VETVAAAGGTTVVTAAATALSPRLPPPMPPPALPPLPPLLPPLPVTTAAIAATALTFPSATAATAAAVCGGSILAIAGLVCASFCPHDLLSVSLDSTLCSARLVLAFNPLLLSPFRVLPVSYSLSSAMAFVTHLASLLLNSFDAIHSLYVHLA